MKPQANDSAFFPYRIYVTSGVEIEIPPITLRKDERIRHRLQKVIESNNVGISFALLGKDSILKILGLALTNAQDDLISIGSIILDRDTEWVENNCNIADLIDLINTFILSPVSEEDNERVDQGGETWTLARLIDFFASKYGWTVDNVLDRTRWELKAILSAASERNKEELDQLKGHNKHRSRRSLGLTDSSESFIRPLSRRKTLTDKQAESGVNALRLFAQAKGFYEKIDSKAGVSSVNG